ncbi:MAG: ABC transporter permease [Coriobacteriales bacterium]|jgi:putative ABC transport system permease protein|nr:ABC transporter permease [Coriobacteriales bacterium]
MGFAKRAILSLVRRVGKTLILFLVILIVGNLIAGMVAMREAINQSERLAKLSLGASVAISLDYQALDKAWNLSENPEIGTLTAEVIEQLGARSEVKSFDYTLDTSLQSSTLKPYYPDMGDTGGSLSVYPQETGNQLPYFNLRGIHHAPVQLIEEGKLSLVSGRVFTESEIDEGKMVALISDKMAETNNLHVGDTIVLVNQVLDYADVDYSVATTDAASVPEGKVYQSRDAVFEVIGIFARNSVEADPSADDFMTRIMQSEFDNVIYAPIKVALAEQQYLNDGSIELMKEQDPSFDESGYEDNPYYTPSYVLNSIDDIESFKQAALEVLPAYYAVTSADSQFEEVAGPLKSIQNVVTIVLIAAIVAALVIISLVVVLFLRDRRKEFGIYLSLGVRKPAVVSQVLVEVFIVALVALGIALFTGNLISGGLSQQLIADQLNAEQAKSVSGGIMYGYAGSGSDLLMGSLSLDDVIASYQVGISVPYVLTFLGLGLGVTMLSCIVPLLYVLRLKPKKILM